MELPHKKSDLRTVSRHGGAHHKIDKGLVLNVALSIDPKLRHHLLHLTSPIQYL